MQTFKKEERLKSSKEIDELFNNGSSFFLHPFKVLYTFKKIEPETHNLSDFPAKIAISVPKRKFKFAHDRNRIKRLVREAYRLNKENTIYKFLRDKSAYCNIMYVYLGNEVFTFFEIEKKLLLTFKRLELEAEKPD